MASLREARVDATASECQIRRKVPYYERIAKERESKKSILAKSEPSAILDTGSFYFKLHL